MVIRLNSIVTIISFLCLLVSCRNDAKEKNITTKVINKEITQVDFLNKKYFKRYSMSVDESTPAHHPHYNYLDCEKEGYFSVHFIPKDKTLISFWKDQYFKENKYEYDDWETENKIVSKLLNGKYELYNIFCFQITKKYLDTSSGCTEESINIKEESIADLYLYNLKTKKWDFLKSLKVSILPPFADNNFFIKNFPDLIHQIENQPSTVIKDSITIPKSSIWSTDCKADKFISIKTKINNIQFTIPGRFSMNAQLKKVSNNKYEFYFTDFPSIIPLPDEMQNWENLDNKKAVGHIQIIDESKINLTWFGFYSKKAKKNIQTENPFIKEHNVPASLIKCSE
ncbi:hypothetical protein C8D70_11046 [Chryseobacterium sp. CBTAP 102]|uniref:hypothetical protein n=1 Tax=unclassified Chryseobacterium TaxID=2593645 RepID=UPI0009573105|nr:MULTISPECIES: hypothetical protein [unclassified Chryseobacterium]PXW12954.1 hypothetical protein C8D70_11046 [Chryseobacterium sp. CBTAP 102]SIR13464.1 hypothetical protein SAMN05880573_116102 [Chryseobacterium sp. RU33C]